jgi:hypothetical protein
LIQPDSGFGSELSMRCLSRRAQGKSRAAWSIEGNINK